MLDHDRIDQLDTTRDKPAVYAWLRSYLRWHVAVWASAVGLRWSENQVDDHLDAYDLVEREWNDLAGASSDPAQLVAVARDSGRPVGIVHVHVREDRYLRMPMGIVSWIFVEPLSRGTDTSRLLMSAAAQWMRARGLDAAEVFVTADNAAAVGLYRRSGYQAVDHRMLAAVPKKPAP